MDTLYIVVYRNNCGGRWQSLSEGELPERRMAENLIECKKATGWLDFEFGIVEGQVVCPRDRAEEQKRMVVS